MFRRSQIIFGLCLLLLSACATRPVVIAENDDSQMVIQDLKRICGELAAQETANRVGNGDKAADNRVGNGIEQANNRVGNGAPLVSSVSNVSSPILLLKTTTGQRVLSVKATERAQAAKDVAERLGQKDFSCP
jgi:hypothetical protein